MSTITNKNVLVIAAFQFRSMVTWQLKVQKLCNLQILQIFSPFNPIFKKMKSQTFRVLFSLLIWALYFLFRYHQNMVVALQCQTPRHTQTFGWCLILWPSKMLTHFQYLIFAITREHKSGPRKNIQGPSFSNIRAPNDT